MESSFLTDVLIPGSLVLIMLGMGLSLERGDFLQVARAPGVILVGMLLQLVVVPLVAWGLVVVLPIQPVLAVGVMIIAACPGGAVSNLVSHLARADTALSVVLTALSSVVTVLTIPLIINLAAGRFLGSSVTIDLPFGRTVLQLASVTLLPVVAGMVVRARFRMFARRSERAVRVLSAVFLGVIILVAVGQNLAELPAYVARVGVHLLALNLGVMALAWLTSRALRLGRRRAITLAIESGIQNVALGITIPASII
ncbi:MAG TPA: bile acid:sodium symporter, partial [Thermoanaerobaculia bacterium]|nr:bile acid:sodium symporter [Thermoanaerobaculia bacterium]